MERAFLAAAIVAIAALVAVVVERRRRPDAPTQGRADGSWPVPTQLDRADFDQPDRAWLVAVFTSGTCDSCAQTMIKASALASDAVAVQEVEVSARPDLHRRYGVEAVPTVVVADAEGVVRASIVGPPSATDLWSAVAILRDPAEGDPAPGDPAEGDPAPGDPAPGDPAEGDPAPGDPAPGDPAGGDPAGGGAETAAGPGTETATAPAPSPRTPGPLGS